MTGSKKVLVTGATGFIGKALVNKMLDLNRYVTNVNFRINSNKPFNSSDVNYFFVEDISDLSSLQPALVGVDVVVHLAGRAHVLDEDKNSSLDIHRKINSKGTIDLAKEAVKAGVKKFIFLSTIGVNGSSTNTPFTCFDTPKPTEGYAISKFEAEISLKKLASETKLDLVIVRPPLVYGPDAPGNFRRLVKLVNKGLPLPLGGIKNSRSFVSIDNLVDLIITCIDYPEAINETFLVSDDSDISTTELFKFLSVALNKNVPLITVPPFVLKLCANIIRNPSLFVKLCDSLQIDMNHTKTTLNWEPPYSIEESLKNVANLYLQNLRN